MIILLVLLLIFGASVVFEIPVYVIILGIVGLIIFALILAVAELKKQIATADRVTNATLIDEVAVYKQKAQITGYSVRLGERRRDHYSYVNVVDHYKCVFYVKYKDGKTDNITCLKNSLLYNELITKDECY